MELPSISHPDNPAAPSYLDAIRDVSLKGRRAVFIYSEVRSEALQGRSTGARRARKNFQQKITCEHMRRNNEEGRQIWRCCKGFTLFETLIVLAIIGIILVFSITISFNSYKGYVFRVERNVLVTILERARSRAMNNFFASAHGICYIAPNYIIFRGTKCIAGAPTNELIPENDLIKINGLSPSFPIVFDRLSGNLFPQLSSSTDETRITLTEDGRVAIISINNEGRINW